MRTIFLLMLSMSPAFASGPEMCPDKEDPIACYLRVERNNAMDELAVAAGKLQAEKNKAVTLDLWLQKYIAGVNEKFSDGTKGKK